MLLTTIFVKLEGLLCATLNCFCCRYCEAARFIHNGTQVEDMIFREGLQTNFRKQIPLRKLLESKSVRVKGVMTGDRGDVGRKKNWIDKYANGFKKETDIICVCLYA